MKARRYWPVLLKLWMSTSTTRAECSASTCPSSPPPACLMSDGTSRYVCNSFSLLVTSSGISRLKSHAGQFGVVRKRRSCMLCFKAAVPDLKEHIGRYILDLLLDVR